MVDLVTLVQRTVSARPRQVAVVTSSASVTYRELWDRVAAATDGDRLLVARDAVGTAVALLAAARAGNPLLLVDPAAPEAEAARLRARFGTGAPPGLGLATSGVTGEPRCVVRPWELVANNAAAFADALGLAPDDTVLTTSSMHHSYAASAGLCGALAAGATFVAPGGLVPPSALAGYIDTHRVTVLLSVPMLYRWYTAGVPATRPPRLCVSAGAALGADIRAAWEKNVGWPLVEHYGTSELGQLTVATPDDGPTVGRSVRGVRIRATVGVATGEPELEALVDGPAALELDGSTARPLTGWVRTGDTGTVAGDGTVTVTGRLGDTVNVGGKKVALGEVEKVLSALPGVREAAVVAGGADPVVPKLVAFVVPDADFSEAAVLAGLRDRLAPHKVPRRIVPVAELPRTGSGKVRRHALRSLATEPDSPPPESVDVPFTGPGSGTHALTWGGVAIRRSIQWLGEEAHYFNDPHVLPLPDGLTLDALAASIGTLLSRHQALRAYYPAGEPVLRVAGAGTLRLAVHSALQDDVREATDRLVADYRRPLFTSDELPLRCAVVVSAGVPRFLVVVLSHQSIDAWTVDIVLAELRQLWAGAELSSRPWQLLDEVADEATGDGRRRGDAALRYWRAHYTAADPMLFDVAMRRPEPKPVRSVYMSSPCLDLASRLAAERLGVSTSVALTGIVAAVLSQLTGHRLVTLLLISANRFDRRRRQLVAPLVQDVLCLVELAGDLDAVIRETARKTLLAYSNACYDPVAELKIRREVEVQRGVCFDFHAAIVNDVRLRAEGTGPTGAADDLAALRAETSFSDGDSWDRQNTKFFVRIVRSTQTCLLELMADTRYLPLADFRHVLAAVESLAVAAATRAVPLSNLDGESSVAPLPRGEGWVRHSAGWVDVTALTELLRRLPHSQASTVAVRHAADTPELTAYVCPQQPSLSVAALHGAVVEALRDSVVAIAPDRYVLCAEPPADLDSVEAWAACRVIAEGDGRP